MYQVQYNGGLLPDIILLTQCYYHRGTRSNAMKRFCLCSLLPVVITESLDTEVVVNRSSCEVISISLYLYTSIPLYLYISIVTAGKCNWRHSGWSVRLVGFPQCYPACRFLTNKILSCSCVGGVSE